MAKYLDLELTGKISFEELLKTQRPKENEKESEMKDDAPNLYDSK